MKYCLLFVATLCASAQTWTKATTTGSPAVPGAIAFGAAKYNYWQQRQMAFQNSSRTGNVIYADALITYDEPTANYQELDFNGQANSGVGCTPQTTDSTSHPGTGHPSGNGIYDFRHAMFLLWTRYGCSAMETSVYSWLDYLTTPSTGPWTRLLTASNSFQYSEFSSVYDPLNNNMIIYGGLFQNSTATQNMFVYNYGSNTGSQVTYAGSSGSWPLWRTAAGMWFDWAYADAHPGEARIGIFGGNDGASPQSPRTDLWYFYPNGSASQSLAANSWQQITQTGTGPNYLYEWSVDYDTLRDLVWAYKDGTHLSAWNPATSTWTDYSTTGGPAAYPSYGANLTMVYDAADDTLILSTEDPNAGNALITYTLNLQTVISKSRTAGNYSTSATATFVARPLAYPALNTPYIDPMGATITRITSSSNNDTVVPVYSQITPTDSSGRYLMTVNDFGKIKDGQASWADTGLTVQTNLSTNAVWSRLQAATLIGSGEGNYTSNKIVQCSIVNSSGYSWSCSVLVDLSTAGYTACDSAAERRVSTIDMDKDDLYRVMACHKANSTYWMFVVNIQTGVIGVGYQINPPTSIGGCTLSFGPDVASVGYLHNYVYVYWDDPNAGNNRLCGLETFDLAAAASPTGSWTFVGQVVPDGTHSDVAVYGGNEYVIGFSAGSAWTGFTAGVASCAVPNGWSQTSHAGCHNLITTSFGGHISSHAYKDTGTQSAIVSNYSITGAGGTNNGYSDIWHPYTDEIYQVYLDSTPSSPHLRRLAHPMTATPWVDNANNAGTCTITSYYTQPHATQSLDGRTVFYGSSWGPQCKSETYAITLSLPPTYTTARATFRATVQ